MSSPFAPGLLIDGYRIEIEIGRGGMAVVYRAVQESLRRDVAIKVLPASLVGSAELRARFHQEALAVARLRHPAILVIHAVGEYHEMPYLVMEYVDGGTLAALLGVPRPLDQVIRLLRPIAEALDYAHGQGILHRDIKPGNILLRDDGSPVLADFGLARVAEGAPHLTRTGLTMGTPAYMAPEQAMQSDAALTPAVDRYALAVIAYELLTGQAPFRGPTPLAVVMAQVQQAPPPPHTLHAGIPAGVEAVLLKGLAKEPRQRYPRAVDFIEALSRGGAIGAGGPVALPATVRVGAETAQAALAAPVTPGGPPTTAVSETAMQALAHSPAHGTRAVGAGGASRRLGPLAAALAVLLAALVGGVGYVLAHHPAAAPSTPTPSRASSTPGRHGIIVVQTSTTPTPIPTDTATALSVVPVPTVTLPPTATPQPSATPVPTHTPRPTATDTPQATYTPLPTYTPFPTSTPMPSATPPPAAPTALAPPPVDISGDACTNAGSSANAVARFYEAVDEKRFDAAYQCLDGTLQPTFGTVDAWASGYTNSLATRLLTADQDASGGVVYVTFYSLDQTDNGCLLRNWYGSWNVNDDNTFDQHHIHKSSQRMVGCDYTVDETAAVLGDNQQIVSSLSADVTGDGQPDHLLLTNGPNGPQVWVYSGSRLVFAEPAPGAQTLQVIGNNGFIVSGNGINETWEWANYGFERVS